MCFTTISQYNKETKFYNPRRKMMAYICTCVWQIHIITLILIVTLYSHTIKFWLSVSHTVILLHSAAFSSYSHFFNLLQHTDAFVERRQNVSWIVPARSCLLLCQLLLFCFPASLPLLAALLAGWLQTPVARLEQMHDQQPEYLPQWSVPNTWPGEKNNKQKTMLYAVMGTG